jgi:predicted nucleotidyltransferase
MMPERLLKKQKLRYSKNVIDIVQFGSSVLVGAEPNDIDVAVIFSEISLKEQLEEAQEVKKQLQEKTELPIHIKSYDFYSFFDKGNFAQEGILFYGKSILTGRDFAESFGLTPCLHISYSLEKLEKKDKVRFNYLLSGKGGSYGLLRKYRGKLLKPGLIEVKPEYENIFTEAIKKITSEFEVKKIFEVKK